LGEIKFSICNELFEKWSLERIFKYLSEIGYEAVEIAPFTITDDVRNISREERKRIRELSETYNVEVAGLHWILVTPKGLYITHPDPTVRERTKEYINALVVFNSDIGGKVIVVGSPKQRDLLPGVTKEKAWEYAREVFKECSKVAEEYDVIICLEPLARHITNFINTAEEAMRMIDEVGSPNFKLILDVYSMCDEPKPIDEVIRSAKGYLAHFHANDANRLGPGFGSVDYNRVVKALMDIDYSGYVSVEVFDFTPGPEFIAEKSLENLRKFFKRG